MASHTRDNQSQSGPLMMVSALEEQKLCESTLIHACVHVITVSLGMFPHVQTIEYENM